MAPASGSVLALAARLRGLEDAELVRLVAARGIRDAGIRDFFDLAEALLERSSVQLALERLDRGTLALLAATGDLAATSGAPTVAVLAERLGVDADEVARRAGLALEAGLLAEESGRFGPWDAVVEQLQAWPGFGLPTGAELADSPPPAALGPVSEADARFVDRGAGDRAFVTLTAVSDLLYALRDEPARRIARGGLALPDARRLGTATGLEVAEIELLLDVAARAGLADADTEWAASATAAAWLALPRGDRWARLATGWLERLPEELVELMRQRARTVWGPALADYLRWLYPAGGSWITDRTVRASREAELLGITGSATPSSPGIALLEDGPAAARDAMAVLFPAEVDSVYLQPDLTVIAPGPLRADLDQRLRGLADAETGGLASSYRVSAASLTRGLVAGETAEAIRAFFGEISVTGVPQPLGYLLDETAARFGTLRVGALDPGAGLVSAATPAGPDAPAATPDLLAATSYIRSDDVALIGQLAVDAALAPLLLQRVDAHRLTSRADRGVVYWALLDARYPVVAEDAAGAVIALRREHRRTANAAVGDDAASGLVARVRSAAAAGPAESGAAWMGRQLELAARTKSVVLVTVRLPDGRDLDYALEPISVAQGRLRARDRRADIERTLPLAAITAVLPA